MENEDYLNFKIKVQRNEIIPENDFWIHRLKYIDEKIFNINYGMKAWYSGYFLESFRNTYKAYLQSIEDKDEEIKNLTLSNMKYCDEKWNYEKIEFFKKEYFYHPYHNYLKKSDIYVFTSHTKNLLKEFIWKVCYQASIINPRWKIIFMLIEGEEINIYFEDSGDIYHKYTPIDRVTEEGEIKHYLNLEKDNKIRDKMTLFALSNYIIVNSSYYL